MYDTATRSTPLARLLEEVLSRTGRAGPKDVPGDLGGVAGSGLSPVVSEAIERIERDLAILERCFEMQDRAGMAAERGGSALERLVDSTAGEDGRPAISKKENEVLQQLVEGRTNREIAEKLGLSEKTVKNHLWKIYRKLGVDNRTQLLGRLLKA